MRYITLIIIALSLCCAAFVQRNADTPSAPIRRFPFATLDKAARAKINAVPRLPLADAAGLNIKNADVLESGNAPNYIRALAAHTKAAPQFANLLQTFIYGGTVQPETKMAMALKIAQIYNSPYAYAHAQRWLRASERGTAVLKTLSIIIISDQPTKAKANSERGAALLKTPGSKPISDAEQIALTYTELLTRDVHGVSDADFAKTRAVYNDAQIVELTMTVSFFNYFTRLVEALNLPVEMWALGGTATTPAQFASFTPAPARIALISDDEMTATGKAVENAKVAQTSAQGLGLGIANSQRAMLRVPALAQTWREYGFQNRSNWTIDRNIQLQISFAVSMANGCRYCTLHQVLGLRRLGVDPAKLVAMKKDDSALTPRELNAVQFARKLTAAPASVTDADFATMQKEFGAQGALEVVMQTCNFAFMNRFTDGLRLPSEDEAVKIYRETYGGDFKP